MEICNKCFATCQYIRGIEGFLLLWQEVETREKFGSLSKITLWFGCKEDLGPTDKDSGDLKAWV